MTTTSNITQLDTVKVFPRVAIEEGAFADLFAFLNACYEALVDLAHVDAAGGTQIYVGHDHGKEGGIGIINGCQATYDGGSNPIYSKTDFVANSPSPNSAWLGKYFVSPGLQSRDLSFLEVAICYEAVGASFHVSSPNSDAHGVEVKESGDGVYDWAFYRMPITASSTWLDLYVNVRALDSQSETITFKVYAIQVVETFSASAPKKGARRLQPAVSSETFYKYFGQALADELVTAEYSLNADTFKRIFSACNALVECVMDQACPGSSTQTIKGHDHSNTNLGRGIGHGKVYSAGCDLERYKGSPSAEIIWTAEAVTTNTWYYADAGAGTWRRTNGTPGGTPSTDPLFDAYVSSLITSSGNPPSANPYLEGWVYVDADDSGGAVELRIYNQTTSEFSEVVSITQGAWNYIRFVPCSGDAWNDFDIQVRHTAAHAAGDTIMISGVVISEAYEYSSNRGGVVDSSGSRIAGIANEGIEKVRV